MLSCGNEANHPNRQSTVPRIPIGKRGNQTEDGTTDARLSIGSPTLHHPTSLTVSPHEQLPHETRLRRERISFESCVRLGRQTSFKTHVRSKQTTTSGIRLDDEGQTPQECENRVPAMNINQAEKRFERRERPTTYDTCTPLALAWLGKLLSKLNFRIPNKERSHATSLYQPLRNEEANARAEFPPLLTQPVPSVTQEALIRMSLRLLSQKLHGKHRNA